jgi:O-antigen/teichoic acid export membrane protein
MPQDISPPSVERQAFVGASWLALFRFTSQIFSWTATILVARMLEPADYGLMEMAVIIPGYAMKLSELGLGPAIIQKSQTTQKELSSVFWFSVLIALALSSVCYSIAPLTAWIFNEPRLLVLTQVVSVLFLLQSLQVVPSNLLKKKLDFKKVGQIEISAVIISSATMLVTAKLGGGVWTLIGGFIALASSQLIFTFASVKWLPSFHYHFREVKSYLRFGILVSLQGTLFYVYDKSDKFFAGRAWQPTTLGQYSLALQLAQLPSEKITVLINHVAFPTFSLLASDHDRFRNVYLKTVNICATLVFPLFVGGYMVGRDLVQVLLSDKWAPIGRIFEFLCLAQIMVSLNAINSFVHNAQGRASWSSINTAVCAILVPLSFFLAVPYGLEAALIPWFTTYVVLAVAWIAITIKKIGITPGDYLKGLSIPFAATVTMAIAIEFVSILGSSYFNTMGRLPGLAIKCAIGASAYIVFLWFFDRRIFNALKALRKR